METNDHTFWEEFIDLYKQHSCLWDVQSKNYANKHKRGASYELLLNKLKEISPRATMDALKKKINNMRTAFRRELKKVQDSMGTGSGADNVYEPTLWYYDLLLFTTQSETGRKGRTNDDVSDEAEVDTQEIDADDDDNVEYNEDEPITPIPSPTTPSSSSAGTTRPTLQARRSISQASHSTTSTSVSRKRMGSNERSVEEKKSALLDLAHRTLTAPEDDEYTTIGKTFAFQLRGMNDRQRIIAEKLISDVMFYGRIGKLSEDATIHFPANKASAVNRFDDSTTRSNTLLPIDHMHSTNNNYQPHSPAQPLEDYYQLQPPCPQKQHSETTITGHSNTNENLLNLTPFLRFQ